MEVFIKRFYFYFGDCAIKTSNLNPLVWKKNLKRWIVCLGNMFRHLAQLNFKVTLWRFHWGLHAPGARLPNPKNVLIHIYFPLVVFIPVMMEKKGWKGLYVYFQWSVEGGGGGCLTAEFMYNANIQLVLINIRYNTQWIQNK